MKLFRHKFNMNSKMLLSLLFLMTISFSSFAQDDCATATSIGTLPNPANCGVPAAQDGSGTPVKEGRIL